MTPLQIKMMIHYDCTSEPYAAHEPAHASSPAVRDQRQQLCDLRLIEPRIDPGAIISVTSPDCIIVSQGWTTTPRGVAYIDALCAMPLPVQKWVMP